MIEREKEVPLIVDIKNKHVVIKKKKNPITNTKLVSFNRNKKRTYINT